MYLAVKDILLRQKKNIFRNTKNQKKLDFATLETSCEEIPVLSSPHHCPQRDSASPWDPGKTLT